MNVSFRWSGRGRDEHRRFRRDYRPPLCRACAIEYSGADFCIRFDSHQPDARKSAIIDSPYLLTWSLANSLTRFPESRRHRPQFPAYCPSFERAQKSLKDITD